MTTFLTPEQYDNLFSSMSNDDLFNAIADNYASLIGQLQKYKDNPSQMPELDRNRLTSLLKACIQKTQKGPEALPSGNYFSELSQENLQAVNEGLGYEKKLLGALKTLRPHTTKDPLGKKDFIKVCETARNLPADSQADVRKRVASGRDTLLTGKNPIHNSPLTYSDKRGITTTVPVAYDSRYSDENEARQEAIKRLKDRNPLVDIKTPAQKEKLSSASDKTNKTQNSTYRMSGAQIQNSSYRM